jgi:hypothetical protein
MGMVISFPTGERAGHAARSAVTASGSATVIILPVIRIERYAAEPPGDLEPGSSGGARRRRRRRAARSQAS